MRSEVMLWGEFIEPSHDECLLPERLASSSQYPLTPQIFTPQFSAEKEYGCVSVDPKMLQILELQKYRSILKEKIDSKSFKKSPSPMPVLGDSPILSPVYAQMSQNECLLFRRKATALVCASFGFEDADGDALDMLSYVMGEVLTNLFVRLHQFEERRHLKLDAAFKSSLSQLFMECGLGSVLNLPLFYEKHVEQQRNEILHQCIQLKKQFDAVKVKLDS